MDTKKMLVALAAATALGVATRTRAATPDPNVVELTVTEKGFDPARVEVTQGQPVKLVVTRITENTCAKEMGGAACGTCARFTPCSRSTRRSSGR